LRSYVEGGNNLSKAKVGSASRFGVVVLLPIDKIDLSPFQVRVGYGDVHDLAESIRSRGLLQPILVRPKGDGRYEVVHGHRRLQACRMIGRGIIEAFVRELSDEETIAIQGIENIQRHDYSPIEEATFYANYRRFLEKRMGKEVSLRELASNLNVNVATITEKIYLLDLPPDIQEKVHRGEISCQKAVGLTILTREKGGREFERTERTDRWYHEIRKLAEEVAKAEREPLKGLRTGKGVGHAAQRIRDGLPFEEAVKEAQLMEAIEATKREILKAVNPREIIQRVRSSQPSMKEVAKSMAEANIKLIVKMLENRVVQCPYCGGMDLVWGCTGKPVGGDHEEGS
jgi:ParB family chromosome partitioning protein